MPGLPVTTLVQVPSSPPLATSTRVPFKSSLNNLYVMLDVFSRYVVGWMVAHRESATLAERFIHETCGRQGIDRGQLTIHAIAGRR